MQFDLKTLEAGFDVQLREYLTFMSQFLQSEQSKSVLFGPQRRINNVLPNVNVCNLSRHFWGKTCKNGLSSQRLQSESLARVEKTRRKVPKLTFASHLLQSERFLRSEPTLPVILAIVIVAATSSSTGSCSNQVVVVVVVVVVAVVVAVTVVVVVIVILMVVRLAKF